MSEAKFIIIYDTYCGWCYGAAPIFDVLVKQGAKVEVLHRHLFQGPLAYRMSKGKGDQVLKADARINELTGQKFSQQYIDNIVLSDTEVLASHYTAQAAALVHDQGAEKEFAVRRRLETARYIDGISAADRQAVVSALIAEGIPRSEADQIGAPGLIARAETLSRRAQDIMALVEAFGVPTLVKVVDNEFHHIDHSVYYGRPNNIIELIHEKSPVLETSAV